MGNPSSTIELELRSIQRKLLSFAAMAYAEKHSAQRMEANGHIVTSPAFLERIHRILESRALVLSKLIDERNADEVVRTLGLLIGDFQSVEEQDWS